MTGVKENEITYRWIDGPALSKIEWDEEMVRIEAIMATRGWIQLAQVTSRIRVAEQNGKLVGFFVLQLLPHLEPLWVAPTMRGSDVANNLIDDMLAFTNENHIRGYVVTADNPSVAKVCEAHELTKVNVPVYVRVQ